MSRELDKNKGRIIKLIVILDLSDNFWIWYSNIEKNPGVENSQFFGAGKMVKKTIKNDKK
jgi:hypothetical protein